MNKVRKTLVGIFLFSLCIALCWGQDTGQTTQFSRDPDSYRVYTLSPDDRTDSVFLPNFAELVSEIPEFDEIVSDDPDREITRGDFAKYEIYTGENIYNCNFKEYKEHEKDRERKKPLVDKNGNKNLSVRELKNYITLKDWKEKKLSEVRFLYLDKKKPFCFLSEDELKADNRNIDASKQEHVEYGLYKAVKKADGKYEYEPSESFHQKDTNGDDVLSKDELADVVTLKDWEKYYLTRRLFYNLDIDEPFGMLTADELNQDPYQGEAVLYEQGKEIVDKQCKGKIENYQEKRRLLKEKGYKDLDSAQCIIDKLPSSGQEEVKFRRSDLGDVSHENPWTKVYVQETEGHDIVKKVDLGSYNLLLLQENERQDSVIVYIGLALLVALIVAVTGLVSFMSK